MVNIIIKSKNQKSWMEYNITVSPKLKLIKTNSLNFNEYIKFRYIKGVDFVTSGGV